MDIHHMIRRVLTKKGKGQKEREINRQPQSKEQTQKKTETLEVEGKY
jgi:hypothetical protein